MLDRILTTYFDKVITGIKDDAKSRNQKIPQDFRIEITPDGADLYSAAHLKYLIYGRPPGKRPPPSAMLEWVKSNPQILAAAKTRFKYITEKGLAFIVGRKIGKEGTEIYKGNKQGIDLLMIMEDNMSDLLKALAANEVLKVSTSLKSKYGNDN